MIIRKLVGYYDRVALNTLIEKIENTLYDKSWWLPITGLARKHFLDDSWTIFVGLFEDDILIGASALFLNPYEWEETATHIQIPLDKKIAEIGRCMVLPEYRGKNYMYEMNNVLLDIARELNIEYILSTVHPNNMSSKQSLIKLGMNRVGRIKKYYERDVYMLDV